MARIAYPSDLTEAQWRLIEKRIPPAQPGGRYRSVNMRAVVNGMSVSDSHGLFVASVATRFSSMGHGALVLSLLSARRHVAKDS